MSCLTVVLSQIASEFTARCGKGIKHMSKAVFSPLFTKLGVPEDKIDDLYRYVIIEKWNYPTARNILVQRIFYFGSSAIL